MALATPWNKEMSNSINLAKQHSSCTLQVYVHPCIYSHKWCRPHEHQWRLIHILCRWVNCVTTDACADHHFEHPESIWSIISIRIGNWQGKWLCSPLQETQIKPHRSSQALRHCTSHKSCHTVHNYGLSPPPWCAFAYLQKQHICYKVLFLFLYDILYPCSARQHQKCSVHHQEVLARIKAAYKPHLKCSLTDIKR